MDVHNIEVMVNKIRTLETKVKHLESHGIPGVRDFFATSALSVLANEGLSIDDTTPDVIAEYAYKLAEAMLKERMRYE